jgi:type 1 glutamine amidotransferase
LCVVLFPELPAYIALVGAQFLKHGTGEFTATIVQPNHPVLDGIQPFQVWDETYVHTKINPEKTVLMERVDDSGREPWTWVREQGKGRVFYTAYGHDERVWGHPMFHRLVRNGILWPWVRPCAQSGMPGAQIGNQSWLMRARSLDRARRKN